MAVQPEPGSPVRAWRLLGIWLLIGAQSFGGGPTTLQFIRREMIFKRGWLTEAEYVRFWTLCTLVPGINLIAFAILIGRKLAGWRGVAATLVGMLLPSTVITLLLTAGFSTVQQLPAFQSMLRGILPATAGLMFVVAITMGRPLLQENRREGRRSLLTAVGFISLAAILISLFKLPVWLVLIVAGVAGALSFSVPAAAPGSKISPPDEIA